MWKFIQELIKEAYFKDKHINGMVVLLFFFLFLQCLSFQSVPQKWTMHIKYLYTQKNTTQMLSGATKTQHNAKHWYREKAGIFKKI